MQGAGDREAALSMDASVWLCETGKRPNELAVDAYGQCRGLFSRAFRICSPPVGCGPDKHIALVLDQAGWHTSSRLVIPEGLHLLFLPSPSPELQPAERLWPLSNEPLANRLFTSLDELEQVQADRCRWLQAHPEVIRGRTSYHWWPSSLDTT
jgi:transposase